MTGPLTVVPLAMTRAAQAWAEQHLDLEAASRQIGAAPTRGFTSGVEGAAGRFKSAWTGHLSALADDADHHADGLRSSAADYLRTDLTVASGHQQLSSLLREG